VKGWTTLGAAAAMAVTGLVAAEPASADQDRVAAVLRDPSGGQVGLVVFTARRGPTVVTALLLPNRYVTASAFHGFHVHANDDPANGQGCVADASRPSTTWFVSADAHYAGAGAAHPHHDGDMPSLLVNPDGTATTTFTTARLRPQEMVGKAVVLHAAPDNFGNVPTGTAPDQYRGNTTGALAKTQSTGNSGDRVACGVVTRTR
jgi:Cu-Zn family superoxide dismutase